MLKGMRYYMCGELLRSCPTVPLAQLVRAQCLYFVYQETSMFHLQR